MLKHLPFIFKHTYFFSKLSTRRDHYNSLYIQLKQSISISQFKPILHFHLTQQLSNNSNAIWIFLNSINLQHLSYLINQQGFKIHHGINNKIAVYKWLSQKSDLVPEYSSCYISCGAVIIKENRILMVQEKNGPRKGLYGIPGGRSDVGEFISQAAQRQLFQQTNLIAKYSHLLYFRQMQNTVFGANDIYFACMMKLSQQKDNQIKLCQRELANYQWVNLNQLKQFCQENTLGTQLEFGIYLAELYQKGHKFDSLKEPNEQKKHNISKMKIFDKSKDNIKRRFVSHRLIV